MDTTEGNQVGKIKPDTQLAGENPLVTQTLREQKRL